MGIHHALNHTHIQILNLLDRMGLKKHQQNFMAEGIDGETLLECDDEVLLHELKVNSIICSDNRQLHVYSIQQLMHMHMHVCLL